MKAVIAVILILVLLTGSLIDLCNGSWIFPEDSPEAQFQAVAAAQLGLTRPLEVDYGCTEQEARYIWTTLRQFFGSDIAAAAVMGNFHAESRLRSTNLQNTYESTLGYTDETYTAAVDDGTYTDFVHDGAGYGLAQWTYWKRKEKLLDIARQRGSSIGDLETQLIMVRLELAGSSTYTAVKQANSIREASDIIAREYEKPADQSEAALARRAGYAMSYFSLFGTETSTLLDTSKYISPSTKNAHDLAQWAIAAHAQGWGYVWGTYGKVLDESLLRAKLEQYPEPVGRYLDFIRENWLGGRTADCVGLIKGYGWLDASTGKIGYSVNGMPDVDADEMYHRSPVKGPVDTIPDIPGLAVYKRGHIGIYIGHGEVVDARGTLYGVMRTRLEDGTWTHWCQVPGIIYPENP